MKPSDSDFQTIASLLATTLEGFYEEKVEPRFDALEHRLKRIETTVDDHTARLGRIEDKLERTIERVDALDQKVA